MQGLRRITRAQNLVMLALTQYFTAYFLVDVHPTHRAYLLDGRLFLLVLSTVMIAAAGYIINDYYDVKIDFINRPRTVVVGTVLRRRVVIAAHVTLTLLGVLISTYLSWKAGLIFAAAAFLLWLYSNQLKRYPLVGNVSIALLSGLAIAVIGLYYKQEQFLGVHLRAVRVLYCPGARNHQGHGRRAGRRNLWVPHPAHRVGHRLNQAVLYGLSGFFIFLLFLMSGALGNRTLVIYFLVLIIPLSYFITRLVYADTKRDFTYLSNFCKLLMLGGILSMAFF